uniref:Phenylalanine-tRNA ligase beta subunit n=1 Tax=Symphyocladia marchantioides TaxID=88360 RepID=UPI0022FD6CE2|nr:Phenylalanine-tRNA ligase beta subunit [Symphyocladia marchantioides]WAX03960.1 Phenylalanine-tRNA ligase beta subunit [Symphyocladia marchantioides]
MKFSLQLINSFINLDHIQFNEFKENLVLSGLEIDDIKTIEKYKDKIIDLNITANREEISSALSLAREASTILNVPITILPIKLKYKNSIERNFNTLKNTQYTHIAYIRIITLEETFTKKTPDWLLDQLKIHNIKHNNILNSIQEYIKIKWGQTFYITNNEEINQQKNIIKQSKLIQLFNTKEIKLIIKNTNDKSKILLFTTINKKTNDTILNNESSEFYENFFIDSIKLINTFIGGKIGKYNEAYEKITIKNKNIQIRKKDISKSLGSIGDKKLKFITTYNINKILKQLQLAPKYCKTGKLFRLVIPNYRANDLIRDIDIIEEIGRIYQFQNFFNRVNTNQVQGYKSRNFIQVKRIKDTLNKMGLHEVINCCITKRIDDSLRSLQIYNPITYEQKELRTNILESLINNYEQNLRNLKNNIEIFEIGKVFIVKNKSRKHYIEKRHIGGLIHNNSYTKNNWSEESGNITLFHFRNIIETFLETINSKATLKEILITNKKTNTHFAEHLLKINKKIKIYDPSNKKTIGLMGEFNNRSIKKFNEKNTKIYIFEINLDELIETTKSNNHLEYIAHKYSNYPSVTRDISVKLEKYVNIEKVKQTIINDDNELIESIEILNEYKNNENTKNNTTRYISIRITYRSNTKTLNTEDIKYIDKSLDKKIKELQQA